MRVAHLRIAAAGVVASQERRTLSGTVVTYGELGQTSIGPLRTAAGALRWGEGTHVNGDLSRMKLTREHDRSEVRGHALRLEDDAARLYATFRVADGPIGDEALADAGDPTDPSKPRIRDSFSFDVIGATVEDGWLIDGELLAVGQVGIPAYANSRIDSVAANRKAVGTMTDDQRARLADLRARQTLTQEEASELATLAALEEAEAGDETPPADDAAPAPAPTAGMTFNVTIPAVAASQPPAAPVPLVPGGVQRPPVTTAPGGKGALDRMVREVCAALRIGGGGAQAISAALTDVTQSGAGANIDNPAWSGELWSGVPHERVFVPLLAHGDLTNFEGAGWRFVTKPAMAPYAGNKAAIPSGAVTTEPATWTASRQAVGHDLDRKFYDFPNEDFLRGYVTAVAQSWSINSDALVEAYIIANATVSTLTADSLFGAVGKAIRAVKRAKMGRATFVMVSDGDLETLLEVTQNNAPAYLDLFHIQPENFVSSEELADGTVIAGNKLGHEFKELPGSPIRASAQHIANGGIDEGFFAYYAFQEHAADAIQSVTWAPPAP